jgi:glycerol uptake facilitator-like aquaporin
MGLATNFVGELLGTFILVFFGCGAAGAALFRGIFQPLMGRPRIVCTCSKEPGK